MKRVAIIVSKSLSAGMVANVAAILCGQLGASNQNFFAKEPVEDGGKRRHAVVNQNVAILKATGMEQLINSYDNMSSNPAVQAFLFSERGQATSNDVELYVSSLAGTATKELNPVALLVAGEDQAVRAATKKFSVYQ